MPLHFRNASAASDLVSVSEHVPEQACMFQNPAICSWACLSEYYMIFVYICACSWAYRLVLYPHEHA
jgi:hypothetical protein